MLENYIDQIITMGTLADSVTIIDDQQIIRHFQPFNPDIVPFTASDVVGTHFRSTFLDVDPADSGVLRALHGESTISRAYTHLLFNGQRSSGIESIFPIRMGDSIIGSISVSRFLSSPNRFLDVKDDPSVSPDLAEIPDMIGNSPAMQTLKRQILRVARTDANVLICGETGTGKELVAHAVHTASPRRKLSDVFKNNKQGDEKVAASHNGDHNIQDLDRGIFSQYDHSRQKHQKDGGIKRRDVEGVGKCRGYRVADHLADAAPADQAGNGKQDGDQGVTGLCLAFAGEKVMDIIGRTAPVAAV